jgi:serine/threonine-protein kinase
MSRRYSESEQALRRSMIVDPASGDGAAAWLFQSVVFGQGDTAAGRALLAALPKEVSPETRAFLEAVLARLARHFDSSSVAFSHSMRARLIDGPERLVLQALNDREAGATLRARTRADSAARVAKAFLDRTTGAGVFGNAADFHSILGLAYAVQGRAAEAVQEGQRAIALNPAARDASEGPRSVDALVAIHLVLGHKDDAIRLISDQAHGPISATTPLIITPASIRLDPLFDGVRDDPRIQALLKNDAAWVVK